MMGARRGHAVSLIRPAGLATILSLAACATSHEITAHRLIGAPRSPISPAQVQLYLEQPAREFERIAVLNASSERSLAFSSQGKAEVVIRRLKDEAAKLGANGVLLQEITYESNGTLDTGATAEYESARGTIDVGIGVSTLMLERYGRAIAIYLEPERDNAP
jgi:hypothetical protein